MRRQYATTALNSKILWHAKELEKGSKDRKYGTASVRQVMRLKPSNERWLGQEGKVVRTKNVNWEQVFSQTRTTVHQMIVAQDRREASRMTLIPSGQPSCRTSEHTLVGMLKFINVQKKEKEEKSIKSCLP